MPEFEEIADNIGKYVMEKYVKPYLALNVSYFRATVTAAASGGKITVQRPFDAPISVNCVPSAAGLAVGSQCVVLVFGDISNAFAIGDTSLSNL